MKKLVLFFSIMLAMLAASIDLGAATVYFDNSTANWSKVYAYWWGTSVAPPVEWPGTEQTTLKAGSTNIYQVTIPDNCNLVIFTNNAGVQTDDCAVVPGATYNQNGRVGAVAQNYTAYYDNTKNWGSVYAYVKCGNNELNGNWPGKIMTYNNTTKLWSTTISSTEVPSLIVFNNGQSGTNNQTDDFTFEANATYNFNGKVSSQGGGNQGGGQTQDPNTACSISFTNPFGWSKVNAYCWTDDTPTVENASWPGQPMTLSNGVYTLSLDRSYSNVIFNDGTNTNKTDDLTFVANGKYNLNGIVGSDLPAKLYILGDCTNPAWKPNKGVEMTKSGSVYTAENVTLTKPADKEVSSFSFASILSPSESDWNALNGSDRYGAATKDALITVGTAADIVKYAANVNASGALSWTVAPGTYNITVNLETNKVLVEAVSGGNDPIVPDPTGKPTVVLAASKVVIQPGKTVNVEFTAANDGDFVGFQAFIALPDALTAGAPVLNEARADGHGLSYNVDSEGVLRIVCMSGMNKAFKGTEGVLFTLPVTAKADAALGDCAINLTNVTFSAPFNGTLVAANCPKTLTIAVEVEAVPAETVVLNKTVLALSIGAEETLTATVLPEDAADKTVTWTSSDTAVATVVNGKVTAVAPGTAVITAACGAASATCEVTVGKDAQSITWDQDLSARIAVGDEVALTATATSGLEVTYVITNGVDVAHLADGKLVADKVGEVTIEARQAGNATTAPAEPVSKTVTVWLGYVEGDVSGDGNVTVEDVTTTVNYILEKNPTPFNTKAADMDGDGQITVVDVTLIVDVILKANANNDPQARPALNAPAMSDTEQFAIAASNEGLRISFSNMHNYIATQFDIRHPEGLEVVSAQMNGSNHNVAYAAIDVNVTRVVVFSFTNQNFGFDGNIDLKFSSMVNGEVALGNALIDSTDGSKISERPAMGTTTDIITGINGITVSADNEYYNLQGLRLTNPERGQVVIERSANGTRKVFIR